MSVAASIRSALSFSQRCSDVQLCCNVHAEALVRLGYRWKDWQRTISKSVWNKYALFTLR